jgi:hypothetical protein
MSQIFQDKYGLSNAKVSQVAPGIDENYNPKYQDYYRNEAMLVEKENSISLWTSPPDIQGAIKDKHRNAGWTAIGEERDSYGNPMPTFTQKLIKGTEFIKSRQMAYAGQDAPGLWGCSQEFYPTMLNFILTIERAKAEGIEPKRALASAGVIESTSYPTLEVVNKQIALEQAETLTHILRSVCTLETTDMLDIEKIWTFTGPGISRKMLGDTAMPLPKKGSFTVVEIQQLDKDMAHVAWTEEFFMKNYEANIRELNLASIPFQMEKSKQLKIATIIDTISGTAGGSWSAFTGADSTRNPYPDIDVATAAINAVDGNPNTFVSSNEVYHAFARNTFVRGNDYGRDGPFGGIAYGNRTIRSAEGVPNALVWGIDNLIPNGYLAVYDRRAVRLRQGPTNSRDYRDIKTGVEGRLWKDWNLAYNWRANLTKRITGVA